MRANRTTGKSRGRRRAALVTVALSLLLAMGLPLTGYVMHGAGLAIAQDEQDTEAENVNPRAEYWRAVREGQEGYTTVLAPEAGVLIQNGGENWRNLRNGPIHFYGASLLIAVIILIIAKHIVLGKDKLDARTGRTMTRWTAFERLLHWYVSITFIILAITGLSLMFGRAVLIPLLGKEGFAAWAQLSKPVHDYLALPFAAGLVVMLLAWIPRNLLKGFDFEWLKSLGGLFSGKHAPAGFINAGEKIFFWLLFFTGIGVTVSGFFLLFPNLGWERSAMQLSNIVHSSMAVLIIAVSLGHIYLGTIGTEGVFEGMVSGEVDEAFAKKHHDRWYEEVKGGSQASESEASPGTSTAAPT